MKLALISFTNLKGDKYWDLILETKEDVESYFEASSHLSAKQFLDVWVSMKNGQTVGHHVNQRIHQSSTIGAAIMIERKASEMGSVSLVEACEIHDKLLFNKLQTMLRAVMNDIKIRVSSKGGFSFFDDMYQTHEEIECDEKQMREYLVSYDSSRFSLSFSRPIVILENDSILSDELYEKIKGLNHKNYYTVFNFKYRTDNWKAEDFFKLFDTEVKTGLHTIIAETTLYDKQQFESLRLILKKVMQNNQDKKLEVKLLIKQSSEEMKQYTENLPENLILTLL